MTNDESLDVLRNLAASLQVNADDLRRLADSLEPSKLPTVAEFMPVVTSRLSYGCKKPYATPLARFEARYGCRRLHEFDADELDQERIAVRDRARLDVRSRGGHGSEEHWVNAVRCFFSVAVKLQFLRESPAATLRAGRRPDNARRALTATELSALWNAIIAASNDPELDGLLLIAAREWAARADGLVSLTRARVFADQGMAILEEKGRKTRQVPVSPWLAEDLLRHARERNPDGDRVFHLRNGRPVSRRRFDTMFRHAQLALPWARELRVSLHWLRHTTASDVEALAGQRTAAAYLGHSDGSSGVTGMYTKVPYDRLVGVHHDLFVAPTLDDDPDVGVDASPMLPPRLYVVRDGRIEDARVA